MVKQRGIVINLEKVKALMEMRSTKKPNEVQSLIGRMAALSRFVLKVTIKCLPFFKVLKGGNKFQWTEKCEEALQELKRHLGLVPFLPKHNLDKPLQLYTVMTTDVVSLVLVRKEVNHQLSIYYVNKALLASD